MEQKDEYIKKRKGHYCCVCQNSSGIIVDGRKISLHRFPADEKISNAWKARIKLVLKRFVYTQNSRLCSAHFVGGCGPQKPYVTVPSIFATKEFKKTRCAENQATDDDLVNCIKDTTSSSFVISQGQMFAEDQACIMHDDGEKHMMDSNDISCVNPCGEGYGLSLMENSHLGKKSLPLFEQDHCYAKDAFIESNLHCSSSQTDVCRLDTTSTGVNCDFVLLVSRSTQTLETVNKTISLAIQTDRPVLTIEDVEDDPEKLKFYTGVPNKDTFYALFSELSVDEKHLEIEVGKRKEIRYIDEFFLVLIRLRLGLLLEDLASRFCISRTSCCRLFSLWIVFLCTNLSPLIAWPSREQVKATMPRAFRAHFPNCRVIIDCTEFFTQKPSSLVSQTLMYSHYKGNMTWKALIGITPNGVLSFASDLWLGSVSDQQIVVHSGLLDILQEGDAIMGDKGFDMTKITTAKGIDLIIPPKRSKLKTLTSLQVIKTRRIASMRIHVERYMSRVKTFRILGDVLSTTTDPNSIWKVCCALTALYPPLNKLR